MRYSKEQEKKDLIKINETLKKMPDYVSSYVMSIEFTTTSKTRREYVEDIYNFFEYVSENYECGISNVTTKILNELSKEYFEQYLHYLQNYEKNGRYYSNGTVSIKRKLSALRGFMTYLFENNKIDTNIITKIKMPKLRHKEIIRMDKDETRDFLKTVEYGGNLTPKQAQYHQLQSTRDLAICYLLLSTGIRVSECVGLDIKDVDFRKSCISIIRKGGKEDTVWFSDEASGYIREYYEQRKTIEAKEGSEEAFFLSSRRSRITDRSVEYIVKKYALKAVPLKKITPHKLRSTYATAFYEQTGDIYLTAENLGHNSIETTKSYAELSDKRKESHRNTISLMGNE